MLSQGVKQHEKHNQELRRIFEAIDTDSTGSIDASEIRTALRLLGVAASARDAKYMLCSMDKDGDGQVSWTEFQQVLQESSVHNMDDLVHHWSALTSSDASDHVLLKPVPGLYLWQTAVAGACGAASARTFTAPLERVKIAAQTGGERHMGTALRRILQREGVRGLFAGNGANCLRAVPTGALACTFYNVLVATTESHKRESEALSLLACGAAAASVANTMTYPLDVVRTRLTLREAMGAQGYSSVGDAVRGIAWNEGWRGFLRGLSPALLAVVPFVAVQNTTIDEVKAAALERGLPASTSVLLAAGASAGIAAQTVTFPLDVLRRRMQLPIGVRGELHGSMWEAASYLLQREGPAAFFRGITPAYCKAIPAIGMHAVVQCGLLGHFKAENKRDQQM